MSYEEVTTTQQQQTPDWRPGQNKVTEYECGFSTGPQYLNPDPEPVESAWDQMVDAWARIVR